MIRAVTRAFRATRGSCPTASKRPARIPADDSLAIPSALPHIEGSTPTLSLTGSSRMTPSQHRSRVLLGIVLLVPAGCIHVGPPDSVDATDGVSGTVLLTKAVYPGNGFLIDKEERLLLASQRAVGQRTDVEVIFPAVENGKVLTKRT